MQVVAIGSGKSYRAGELLEYNWLPHRFEETDEIFKLFNQYSTDRNHCLKLDANASWFQGLVEYLKARTSPNHPLKDWYSAINQLYLSKHRQPFIYLFNQDTKIESLDLAYLKLHLISRRIFKPNSLNLDGLFPSLINIAWTNHGAIKANEINHFIWEKQLNNQVVIVKSVDKFPAMTDYYVPPNVRIANSANVRLGAYLGEGTTIMHAGFVNFNAGGMGPNMIEGRLSAGVVIAENTDIGGGASTMGRLSGGGQELVALGKNCLLGANAGLGIPLGDNCTIEAGLYLTASSKVRLRLNQSDKWLKAQELKGKSNLLFRRNSTDGVIECLANDNVASLNELLHLNQ